LLTWEFAAVSEHYRVRLEKEELGFSAAHFITFDGDVCEQLHGHNYRVAVELEGPLDENHYVVDFIALYRALRSVLEQLDHRVLLPTGHPQMVVSPDEREVEVRFQDRRWVFPRGDCQLLPVANTTAELLARHIGQRLLDELERRGGWRPQRLWAAVDENAGQWGVWELRGE
jgi:6-pyruvoyltetrahydropterin/6-carboxytetrahydropterin synthase